ncbi:MAG: alpha/beta hydrolase [Chloroflexota bacterium]
MSISIPYYDFGGEGPLAHFAHANGYPPPCYRRMMTPLVDYYHVLGVCHRPLWPDSRPAEVTSWRIFAEDMMRFFDEAGLKDLIGIGHSLGAVTTMYAAVQRPELFRALVLIEPVFLPPAVLQFVPENLTPDQLEHFPLVRAAMRRKNGWGSRHAAFARFRRKAVFERWSDAALWDYVNYGLRQDGTGQFVLEFAPEWEARIYALPPRDVWQVIPQVKQPTLAIRAAETDTLQPAAWQLWQTLQPQAQFVEIPHTGHLLTMEDPWAVGRVVLKFLQEIGDG